MRLLPHGAKIGNATVIVDIVETSNREVRPRTPMKAKGATDHDTGNTGKGADAKAHNRLLHNWGNLPVKDTSHICWHVSMDENFIIQHIPFDEAAYHCGDGWGLNSGNRTTIGIEKCMHQGADRQKIEANAIALYAYLMKEMNFPITWIRPHQHWSGKYCPQLILNKYGSFRPFRDKIEAVYKGGVSVSAPKPPTINPATTDSIVDYLNALGRDSSPAARAKLALGYGISGYTGTAAQNTLLLQRMRANWKPTPAPKPVAPVSKPKEEVTVPKETPAWKVEYDRQVKRAKELGFTDGTRPKEPLTREEGGVIAVRVYEAAEKLAKK